ncbi:hypothetical protein [Kumtagia ephedrae]|uniref:hypothetical protein n=1 Tax=Kumtagia ephedrae TaxID=2116701 RepID=UPI0010574A65|nr:hypothetical protein [Mesorhizobium ephedrae]
MFKPYGVTIFCDDIRSEIGGKHTFVGVYGANLIITQSKPVILPSVSIAATLVVPNEFKFSTMVYTLKKYAKEDDLNSEDYDLLIERKWEPKNRSEIPGKISKHIEMVSMSPFPVENDCLLASRAYFDDLEIKLGVLPIKFLADSSGAANTPSKSGKRGD